MIGSKIDNYRITSILGEGGMGVVYKAFDLKLERYVALKILNQKAITNPQFVERFKREAKNQAQLSHPNIVPVYGFTDDINLLGFVMEYVNGETLEHRIEKRGRLELIETLEIMKQVLSGAVHAHSRGFIHRDLKPSNIIFTQDDIAKIMDFGISKSIYESKGITKSGVKVGTLLYMSPEQIKAQEPTQQSDIYALGIIFYEILCGKNPYDGDSDFQIMEAHLKKYPPRLNSLLSEIPDEVDRIIFKAIAKSTEKRYKDTTEFYNDVDQELIRLKSEQRKTRETMVNQEVWKRRRIRFSNYLLIMMGIILSSLIIYLAYNSVSGYFTKTVAENKDIPVNVYDSSPFRFAFSGWQKIVPPTNESLTSICMNDNTGLICGFSGTLLQTSDTGETWQKIKTGTDANLYSVYLIKENKYLIAGEKGNLFRYNMDDGILEKINTFTDESLFKIYFQPDMRNGFISGGGGIILKTSDGGEKWKKINTKSDKLLYSINFLNEKRGIAVGWDGEMLVTDDGGSSWSRTIKIHSGYLRDITFIDNKSGFTCGGEGAIYKTTDAGISWKKVNSGISSGLYFINFINENNGYILGSRGEILYSEDSGESWQVSQTGSYSALTGTIFTRQNTFFIIGYNGIILSSR